MRKYLFVWCVLTLFPACVYAASIGFVPASGVWFSNDPVFSGAPLKVFTVVVNNQYQSLSATIAFTDNGDEFARTSVTIPHEDARQTAVAWTPTFGSHIIVAKFVSATATDDSGAAKQLSQTEIDAIAPPISRTIDVDNDSDHDGLGDHEEINTYHTNPLVADTDGDGLTDYQEVKVYHTDPLKADTDGDGMNDGDEVKVGRNPLVPDAPPTPPPSAPTVSQNTSGVSTTTSTTTKSPQKNTAWDTTKKSTQSSSPKNVSAQTVNKKSAPVAPRTPLAASSRTTTTHETQPSTSTPPTAPIKIALQHNDAPSAHTADTTHDTRDSTNWIKVLGIIAVLLAVAAAVSSALAVHERNKY